MFTQDDDDDEDGDDDNAFSSASEWEPNLSSTMARYGWNPPSAAGYDSPNEQDDENEIEEDESAQQGNEAWEADFSSASFASNDNGGGSDDLVNTDARTGGDLKDGSAAAEGGWVANFDDAFGGDATPPEPSSAGGAVAVPSALEVDSSAAAAVSGASPTSGGQAWATKRAKPVSPRTPSASPDRKEEDDSQTGFNDASFWRQAPVTLSDAELEGFD